MKNLKSSLALSCCLAGLTGAAVAQSSEPPPTDAVTPAAATVKDTTAAKADSPAAASTTTADAGQKSAASQKLITLNFRGAPLELVLNYLSDAAGFIILPETDVHGKVDIWASHPVTREETVALLDQVLRKNGYAAIQMGRTLSIVTLDDAKKRVVPTEAGSDPDAIPNDDRIATHIIPIRSISAVQAAKEFKDLLSPTANLVADEAGNALVMTDTHANIRRLTEIVHKLDDITGSVNTVRVFPLRYEDAKTLAGVIKELFPAQDTAAGNGRGGGGGGGRFRGFGGGGGGGGPFPFGGGAAASTDANQPRTPKVTVTADDHSNSLVVSAPDELMPIIEGVIHSVDQPVQDITAIQVFKLKNADPTEMCDLLSNLFPDDTSNGTQGGNQTRFAFPFGGPGGFRAAMAAASANESSDRTRKLGKVTAVPDKRTASVVVSASKVLMPQIEAMIEDLDKNPARKQKVHVVSLKNAAPEDVQLVLNDIFQSTTTSSRRTTSASQNGSPITTRGTTLENQMNQNSSSTFGSSSFGSGGKTGF